MPHRSENVVTGVNSAAVSRKPVTRERALQVAVGLADEGGIEALSMRKLAGELGIEAMSLYYHVKNKNEILDGMVEIVVSEMAVASADTDWKSALRERAYSERDVLIRHPWAISEMDARTTQATLRYHDAIIGNLRAAGFSMPMVGHALSVVDSYVHGFALQEASLPLDPTGDISAVTEEIMAQQEMMAGTFPHLAEMGSTLILQPEYAYGNEFDFGIGLILDGIELAHAAEVATAQTDR